MKIPLQHTFVMLALHMLFLLSPNSSYAMPLDVTFDLHVDSVSGCSDYYVKNTAFGCSVLPGNDYIGSFTVLDPSKLTEGLNTGVQVSDFYLRIGDITWNQNNPTGSAFRGFRDSVNNFAVGPGLVVHYGKIVDLFGGVFGPDDVPYVDFMYDGVTNRFAAHDLGPGDLHGSLTVNVPEPGTLLLFLVGALALACIRPRARHVFS
jgi:hypothetical protein